MVQTASAERSEARRAAILKRAAEVFRTKGFHRAGMREIARRLGIAPGSLYYYFESKQDLLYACQVLSLKRLEESARRIAAGGAPARDKLAGLVRAHLGHVLDELGGSSAHIEFHALPDDLLRDVVARRDAYERVFRGVIEEGVRAGEFKDTDAKLATLALLGSLNWTVVWWRPEGGRDLDDLARRMAATFLEGLAR